MEQMSSIKKASFKKGLSLELLDIIFTIFLGGG